MRETQIGGASSKFPATSWSAIVAARSENVEERQQAFSVLVNAYWKPVYKYIRLKWQKNNEDAKDLTQGFFAIAIEKRYFDGFEPGKSRFRTFLRSCLDGFLANTEKASQRLKRGGGLEILSLDFGAAEWELQHAQHAETDSADAYFEREWIRHLLTEAVEQLRRECESKDRAVYFEIFHLYDLHEGSEAKPTYQALAREFDLPATKVTNYLAYARRQFRCILLERLREITGSEQEFRQEAHALIGVKVS